MNNPYKTVSAILFSAGLSLNVFWIANILKEAYPMVKSTLNFYPITGPLLGLYMLGIIIFAVSFAVARSVFREKVTPQWVMFCFVGSTILFFLTTFPPILKLIVDFIK